MGRDRKKLKGRRLLSAALAGILLWAAVGTQHAYRTWAADEDGTDVSSFFGLQEESCEVPFERQEEETAEEESQQADRSGGAQEGILTLFGQTGEQKEAEEAEEGPDGSKEQGQSVQPLAAEPDQTVFVSDEDELSAGLSNIEYNDGTTALVLATDIETTAALSVPSGVDVMLDLAGCTITGDGSGSALSVSGTLTILDSSATEENPYGFGCITGGSAEMGGGIYVSSGAVLVMEGGSVSGNTATTTGGGIYTLGTVTIRHACVTGNVIGDDDTTAASTSGGAGIYIAGGTVSLYHARVSENIAYHCQGGGGIYAASGSTLYVYAGTKIGANFLSARTLGSNGDGGGIYSRGTLTITCGTRITGNWCNGAGGGVYANAGNMTVGTADPYEPDAEPVLVAGNVSYHLGGGLGAGGAITISNTNLYGNSTSGTSNSSGGGIYTGGTLTCGGHVTIGGTETFSETIHAAAADEAYAFCGIEETTVAEANYAGTNGGGIYAGGVLTLSDSAVIGNEAAHDGGGIYAASTLSISDSSICRNASESGGGGIYVNSSGASYIRGTAICENDTVRAGGGIYAAGSGDLLISDTLIDKNTVTYSRSGSSPSDTGGGGIYAASSLVDLTDCSVSYNKTYFCQGGGGIFAKGNMILHHGTIVCANYNSAVSVGNNGDGGGIYVSNSSSDAYLTIYRGVVISGNDNEGAGGGVYCYQGAVDIGMTESGYEDEEPVQIIGNASGRMGGGVGTNMGKVTIQDTDIYGNRTLGTTSGSAGWMSEGGGVYLYAADSSITINEGTLIGGSGSISVEIPVYEDGVEDNVTGYETVTYERGNYAELDGGGVYVYAGSFEMNGGDVLYNIAGQNGGGVCNAKNSIRISGGTIAHNEAALDGGGVYCGKEITLSACKIAENEAALDGGGLYSAAETTLQDICQINGNTAGRCGGGLYSAAQTGVYYSTIDGNTAGSDGGGLYSASETTLEYSTIDSNVTVRDGGGLFSAAETTLYYCEVSYNEANYDGGGVYSTARTILIRTLINGNKAHDDGGGIYSGAETYVYFGQIDQNDAIAEGGGVYSTHNTVISEAEISGNCTAGNGGGVYIDGAKLVITDGMITENKAGFNNDESVQEWIDGAEAHGGGVYIDPQKGGGELEVSGCVIIKDNLASDTSENVYLFTKSAQQTITIVGELTCEDASIGVTTETTPVISDDVQITTTETDTSYFTDHARFFFADQGYGVRADDAGGTFIELYIDGGNVTIVNESVRGTLSDQTDSFTYTLSIDGAAAFTDYTYTVCYENGTVKETGTMHTNAYGQQTADFSGITEGMYIVITDLPSGTEYVVSVTKAGGYFTDIAYEDQSQNGKDSRNYESAVSTDVLTVTANNNDWILFSHTYNAGADLSIQNRITGSLVAISFAFTVTVTGLPQGGTYTFVQPDGTQTLVTADESGTLNLSFMMQNGSVSTICGVNADASYTITSEQKSGYTTSATAVGDESFTYAAQTGSGSILDTSVDTFFVQSGITLSGLFGTKVSPIWLILAAAAVLLAAAGCLCIRRGQRI